MKYEVCIREAREKWVLGEADDVESAQAKAEQMYRDAEISIGEEDIVDTDFMVNER